MRQERMVPAETVDMQGEYDECVRIQISKKVENVVLTIKAPKGPRLEAMDEEIAGDGPSSSPCRGEVHTAFREEQHIRKNCTVGSGPGLLSARHQQPGDVFHAHVKSVPFFPSR